MPIRPSGLAPRMSTAQQSSEKFTLPVYAARSKAREIIKYSELSSVVSVIENWRQLADGQIEFTVRRLPAAE